VKYLKNVIRHDVDTQLILTC